MCSCNGSCHRTRRVLRPRLVPLGELRGLIYHCRRAPWLAPASYVHFFDRRPTLATDPAGRRLFIVGGCYRVTPRGIVG